MGSCRNHRVGRWWKHFVIVLAPLLLLLPLLLIPEEDLPKKANQCLYVMLLMAVYWCTEVLSLAVTSLMPVFLFPMLGILTTEEVCNQYLKDTVMMFVGGLMVALSVEKCNLHRRIAVSVLHVVGTKPMWLMLGFMLPTWFLSMWISNTATTSMMLPIAEAVLESLTRSEEEQLAEEGDQCKDESLVDVELSRTNSGFVDDEKPTKDVLGPTPQDTDDIVLVVMKGEVAVHPDLVNSKQKQFTHEDSESASGSRPRDADQTSELDYKSTGNPRLDRFAKGMTLAVAYAANTGGTATLIGTGPNPVMKDHADSIWKSHGYDQSPVTFASWFVMGFPVATINLIFVWLWLVIFFSGFRGLCPCRTKSTKYDDAIKKVIDKEYESLGKITYAEVTVSCMFVAMVLLWFFQSPGFMTGWSDLSAFKPGYIDDAVVSIFIAFVLCIIPSKLPTCSEDERGSVDTLLDWKTVHQKLPWGVVFLMGGGFSIARASEASGLSDWIAEGLTVMADWPDWVMVFTICLITAFLTEITSNVATCTILMPIVSSLAEGIGHNPLYLMFPVALSTSFAFMLPVATPPNAIAFSYGRLRILDMVKAGFILNFICVAVVTMGTHTWGDAYFNFDEIPWEVNSTMVTTPVP